MMNEIIICPKCISGALKPAWYNSDYIECVKCGHRVKIK